ncbi:unnamed protein product, partial [Mesorhabditis belari]|uniref:Acyltransferase 3 domain-containing protein n=1 Tax=Mesorhabditis belari TaxID=2138241 RepID=A0AAF3ETH3_9BILA
MIVLVAKTHPQQNSRYGMEQKAAAKEFREDVSLLRAFAVLAVLGYHHWPTVFSLGFIGVDIFFVISGFLMIQILEQAENDRFYSITLNFYYRRVKRLVPLYYLIMFMIGFSMMFVYTSIWSKQYFGFYFGAIFFYSNLELLKADGDYFAENTEKLPFLHSWSLGVEMQYYLIAPLLFFISKISISTIIPSHSNILSAILLIITSFIFLPFIPQVAPPSIHQLIITVSSAGYILFGVNSTIPWSSFHLTYISAISYALYLVHYPVLRFAEYLQENARNVIQLTFLNRLLIASEIN